MDRIQELLGRITDLSDDELNELRDLILQEFDANTTEEPAEGEAPATPADPAAAMSLSKLEALGDATVKLEAERGRRADEKAKRDEYAARVNSLRPAPETAKPDAGKPTEAAVESTPAAVKPVEAAPAVELATETPAEDAPKAADDGGSETIAASGQDAVVPEDRKPKQDRLTTSTVVRASADIPGFSLGQEFTSSAQLADALCARIDTMRGLRGADGDKLIVASAQLMGLGDDRKLLRNDPEGNMAKVMAAISPQAITAAGGLAAPEEVRYELFDMVGDTDRPIKSMLPSFTSERGGVRFMRPPTLNDVAGVVGIWTIADDIDAMTDEEVRKPSFRVLPGPEIVVNTQAITMIMTFGNLMSRAYPELVKRHTELALVAQARVAEQQLLTQIGALSTAVTTDTQKVGAVREMLRTIARATAAYRNRHRMQKSPMRVILPIWFRDLLRADIFMQHPGDGLETFAITDAQIEGWFKNLNINITWAIDGEAGQDYTGITTGSSPNFKLIDYPTSMVWYMFSEGTFAFMDGGTLDLGLVRDSTLNAANDYQTFVETFESVVKFGHQSLRITSQWQPTGQGSADKDPALIIDPTPTQPT